MPWVDPCTLLTYHNYNFCLRVVSHENDAIILLAFSSPTHAHCCYLTLTSERVHLWPIVSWWLTSKIPRNGPRTPQKNSRKFLQCCCEASWQQKAPKPLCYSVEGPGIRVEQTISVLRVWSKKCGLVYQFECYSTVNGMSWPRFLLVSLTFIERKGVAPTGRLHWGQNIKIGLINCKHSTSSPGSTPLHRCYSALTRNLVSDCVTFINTSSFFMFHKTFSSLHFHRVWKHFSVWSVWLATRQCAGRGFWEPKQTQRYHTNMTSGVRNGKNKSEDLEMLQHSSQNCFHAHQHAKTFLRVIGTTLQSIGKNPCVFKKVIPSSFGEHEPSCLWLRL